MRRPPRVITLLGAAVITTSALWVAAPAATDSTPVLAAATTPLPAPTTEPVTAQPQTSPPEAAPPPQADPAVLAEQVLAAVRAIVPRADVGLVVFDLDKDLVVGSLDADQQFKSASVVKLLIALKALHDDPEPDEDLAGDIHQMLAFSDDGVASALWGRYGGNRIVSEMADLLGLAGTEPPGDQTQWGDTLITAQDVITIYTHVHDELAEPQRSLVLTALAQAGEVAADGFDQYFGIPDGLPNTDWAVKQGWMRSRSAVTLHTTGLIGPNSRYAVALLTALPAGTPYATGTRALTAGAAALAPGLNSGHA